MNKTQLNRIQSAVEAAGLVTIAAISGCSTTPATNVQSMPNNSALATEANTRIEWINPAADHAPSIDVTYKNAHPPKYPKLAIIQHHQGVVVLDVTIDAKGRVIKVEVEHSSGYQELDESAALAAHDWKYGPGIRSGKSLGGIVRVPITFHL